jgi:hypothetical protein
MRFNSGNSQIYVVHAMPISPGEVRQFSPGSTDCGKSGNFTAVTG